MKIQCWLGILLIVCLFMVSCAGKKSEGRVAAEVPSTVTAADLLADALMHYEAGDYEEAIIAYMGVIEIEPKNIEAQIGLGRAYRNAGKNEEAIAALTAAREMDAENREAAYELGYAYIGAGQHEAAQSLAEPLWQERDTVAGIVLLMSLAGQEMIEEVQELMQDEALALELEGFSGEDSLYMGGMDENGRRSGHGVGLYPGGYLYVGNYSEGIRNGQGCWYYPESYTYFIGEWAGDAPNGYGEVYSTTAATLVCGNYSEGLENGNMKFLWFGERSPCKEFHDYQSVSGKRHIIDWVEGTDGQYARYASCNHGEGYGWGGMYPYQLENLWGILPWAVLK